MAAVKPSSLRDQNAGTDGGLAEAQEAINFYLKPGIGTQRSVKAYDDTSEKYEDYVGSFEYTGPQQVAKTTGELFPDQRDRVRILDVAAGTGLVGVELEKLGFRQLDALDPSQGMLDVAAKRNIYGQLFTEFITDKPLPIEKGGYIVNVTRVEHLENCSDYIGRLEQLMETLEKEGRWRQVTRTTFPNFLRGKEGLLMVHQVL